MIESELIRRAQTGDQEAFRQLMEIYAPMTERVARALLPARLQAEYAVEDAWLHAWRGLRRFDGKRPFRSWILGVVADSCYAGVGEEYKPAAPVNEPAGAGGPGGPAEGEDEEFEEQLRLLPPDCRKMLELRYSAGLELEEVADVLHAPLGTIRSRLPQALEILREKLAQSRLQTAQTVEVS